MAGRPRHVVVMGVAGSGKTTVGAALAAALGWRLVEGDAFHPAANVAKMAAGQPLDDADRAPWLAALAAEIGRSEAAGFATIVCCSALRRAYRDVLRSGAPGVAFVHLDGPRGTLAARLGARSGHFFPSALLDTQLAALEPLGVDEPGTVIDVAMPVEAQIDAALRGLGLSPTRVAAGEASH